MTENLKRIQQEADLNRDQIAQLVRNAFEASWLESGEKTNYLARVNAFIQGH